MTAAERLQQLSSLAGVSAAVMLLTIGTGATAAEALVDYSGLPSGTAAEHLLVDHATGAILKYWTGAAWTPKTLKYWSGASWATKPLKRWNGSAWV